MTTYAERSAKKLIEVLALTLLVADLIPVLFDDERADELVFLVPDLRVAIDLV